MPRNFSISNKLWICLNFLWPTTSRLWSQTSSELTTNVQMSWFSMLCWLYMRAG